MNFDGNILTINAEVNNDELSTLADEILAHINEIKEIRINYENGVESSALFALLYSIRKTNPKINIPMLDEACNDIDGIGLLSLNIRG